MNTEDKLKLIGLCLKLVPIGAVGLADDLEKIIDKHKVDEKKQNQKKMDYETDACKICEIQEECMKIPLVEPLISAECPHTIRISIFRYRQSLKNRYLAHLGSY